MTGNRNPRTRRGSAAPDEAQRGTAFAKTTRPAIGNALRREALFARLDGAPGRTIAWISGPPGAGKSTLAASWVEARARQCVWYQVDADDADVATFFHYLAHAAGRLDGRSHRRLPVFGARSSDDVASFARRFFRDLYARARAPAALVLDGLDDLADGDPLGIAIEAALGEVPRHWCVVVTSRVAPPVALARHQASGAMVCVDGEALRFDAVELAAVAQLRGIPLPDGSLAALEARTRGWAAGVVLLLEHTKLAGRLADVPDAVGPRALFDYVAGEIFSRFEADTRRFLTRIAKVTRVTEPVARVLSGDARAGRLLRNLAHNDYFVREVRSGEGVQYHLHPLLRDFLRQRGEGAVHDVEAMQRLRSAAELLCETGQVEDAVALFAEAGEWAAIAGVAGANAAAMLSQGRGAVLAAWLDLLPPGDLERDPQLLLVSALCRVSASPRSARQAYVRAYAGFEARGDAAGMLAACAGTLEALLGEGDDYATLDDWIGRAVRLAPAAGEAAAGMRIALPVLRAMLVRAPGHGALPDWLARVVRASAAGEAAAAGTARVLHALLRGELATADSALADVSGAASVEPGPRIAARLAAALRAWLDGEAASAAAIAAGALDEAEAEGMHGHDAGLTALLAAARLDEGDAARAEAALRPLEAGMHPLRRSDAVLVRLLRGRIAELRGDELNATREARGALAGAIEAGAPWYEALARIGLVRVLAAAGDHLGALAQVRAAAPLVGRLDSPPLSVALALLEAHLAQAAGDVDAFRRALAAGLAEGRRHGFRHVPLVGGAVMAGLCAAAIAADVDAGYARALARSGRWAPPAPARGLAQWPWTIRVRVLGAFELERDGVPVEFAAKGPGRPVELLKVLIALGGASVRVAQIADALWPRVDADYAHKSFTITLHRLRRMLGDDRALVLRDGRLSLDPALVWVDALASEHVVTEIEDALHAARPADERVVRDRLGRLGALYRGAFLPDEDDQPAYAAFRDRVRLRVGRVLQRVARGAVGEAMHPVAEDVCQRCVDADPSCEGFHRALIECHRRRGDRIEAMASFERLRRVIAARPGAAGSAELDALHETLQREARGEGG